jgi:5-methyltetrahydropteroyltriglutamate--homocysteine methyltransferase
VHADSYLERAQRHATRPIKQAVISASALSLLYPGDGIDGYSRDEFISDLLDEAEADIRRSLARGADSVQIDFTEGRLSLKLDPSGRLLRQFLDLNNTVLERFTAEDQQRIGVHSCPGGDQDSTHSADVDYAGLLPGLLGLSAGRFYLELAGEPDRRAVLETIRTHLKPGQRIFVGVTDPIDPAIETAETGPRPRPRSSGVHSARPARNDRRLRVRPVWRRHVHRAARPPSRRSGRASTARSSRQRSSVR